MKLLELLRIRPPVAMTLPAGEYAFLHMFDQDANGLLINGECRLSDVSLPEQLEELSQTLELKAKSLEHVDINDLTVTTFLTPITESKAQFCKEIGQKSSRTVGSFDGFLPNGLFAVDGWAYRDTSYCASWLIELNLNDPELLRMNANE